MYEQIKFTITVEKNLHQLVLIDYNEGRSSLIIITRKSDPGNSEDEVETISNQKIRYKKVIQRIKMESLIEVMKAV